MMKVHFVHKIMDTNLFSGCMMDGLTEEWHTSRYVL